MSDLKSKSNASSPSALLFGNLLPLRWTRYLVAGTKAIPQTVVASMVGPMLLLIAGYFGWTYYGAERFDRHLHSLTIDNIHMTPQPPWIKQSVLETVFNEGGLKQLSTLERQTNQLIDHALRRHPWIRDIKRITKEPNGGIRVDVEYRKPVALVYCDASNNAVHTAPENEASTAPSAASNGFLPIDQDAYLLPRADFTDASFFELILVYAKGAFPAKLYANNSFGDPRIEEAAVLCQLLAPLRADLEIASVYVETDSSSGGASPYVFEIELSNKRTFSWGHAPGREAPGEPNSKAKLRKLIEQFHPSPGSAASAMVP